MTEGMNKEGNGSLNEWTNKLLEQSSGCDSNVTSIFYIYFFQKKITGRTSFYQFKSKFIQPSHIYPYVIW